MQIRVTYFRTFSLHIAASTLLFPSLIGALVTWSVMQHGIPALRHDWRIPVDPSALGPTFAGYLHGWTPLGIGEPQPYPTFYFIGVALWGLHFIFGAATLIGLFIFATILIAAISGMRISQNFGGGYVAQAAVATFLCLNPWVYSKYVAGHIYMIFAYAVVVAIVAEISAERPRSLALLWWSALSVTQLEFFLIAAPLICLWALRRRRWYVAAMLLVAALPIAIGILAYRATLLQTPFLLPWQQSQSIPLVNGLELRGYAFHYADAFDTVRIALYVFPLVAIAALPLAFRRPVVAVAACVGLAAWIFSSGTLGPIAPVYSWLVIHITEIGVFRELYDLIAVLAIGYAALLAVAVSRSRLVAYMVLPFALALCVPWITKPIGSFTVPAARIPAFDFPNAATERVALFPAFQPLTLNGAGSGYDPDLFVRSREAIPLNEFYPEFPVDEALALGQQGNLRYLAFLGVTQIIHRPYLRENTEALKYQLAGLPRSRAIPATLPTAIPLLSVLPEAPQIVTIGDSPLDHAVFFADASTALRDRARLVTFYSDRSSIDARQTWIDTRLIVPAAPEWGNGFGGVYTRAAQVWLPVPNRTEILALTTGQIVDAANRVVAYRTRGYHWWKLSPGAFRVRCIGECAVALAANVPGGFPEHHAMKRFAAIPIRMVLPWVYTAHVPAGTRGALRFNERYDTHWVAFLGAKRLQHERLDTMLNAWLLPHVNDSGDDLYIIQTVALLQAAAELLAMIVLIMLSFAVARLPESISVNRRTTIHAAYEE